MSGMQSLDVARYEGTITNECDNKNEISIKLYCNLMQQMSRIVLFNKS